MASENNCSGEKPSKIAKLSEEESIDTSRNSDEKKFYFSDFTVDRILNENVHNKSVFVEGKFSGKEGKAIVIMEKTPFAKNALSDILSKKSKVEMNLENDIYKSLKIYPLAEFNALKSSVIYPATEKHVKKYSTQDVFMVKETPEVYNTVTLPQLTSDKFSIQWVYNILDKKCESERVLYEDEDEETGFILLPDMKWDGKLEEDISLVAIVRKHGVKSLRDLTPEHLPLLQNILDKAPPAITERYGVRSSQLRIYLHYQPSYYHLHVHFSHIRTPTPGSGVERAHLLSDVIDNIQLMPDYYQKKTLYFPLRESDSLLAKFKEAGLVDCQSQ